MHVNEPLFLFQCRGQPSTITEQFREELEAETPPVAAFLAALMFPLVIPNKIMTTERLVSVQLFR